MMCQLVEKGYWVSSFGFMAGNMITSYANVTQQQHSTSVDHTLQSNIHPAGATP